jgi:hypothetical protein
LYTVLYEVLADSLPEFSLKTDTPNRNIKVLVCIYLAVLGYDKKVFKILVEKPEGKRSLGRPWHG